MKKYLILFFLCLFSVSTFAMSNFEEDSWIGAIIMNEELSFEDKIMPIIDIRNNNINSVTPDDIFKLLVIDSQILLNLSIFPEPICFDCELTGYIESILGDYRKKLELLLVYELQESYLSNYHSINHNDSVYRFYHFYVNRFEEITLDTIPDLKTDASFNQIFQPLSNEYPESVATTNRINRMLPLDIDQIKKESYSPFVTIFNHEKYKKEDKENLINSTNDIELKGKPVFKERETVAVSDVMLSVEDFNLYYGFLVSLSNKELFYIDDEVISSREIKEALSFLNFLSSLEKDEDNKEAEKSVIFLYEDEISTVASIEYEKVYDYFVETYLDIHTYLLAETYEEGLYKYFSGSPASYSDFLEENSTIPSDYLVEIILKELRGLL